MASPDPEDELELPYLQTQIDVARRDAQRAERELKAVLQAQQPKIEKIRTHVVQANEEVKDFCEFFDSAKIPAEPLERAKVEWKDAKSHLEHLNGALSLVEPMYETQRQLEELDGVSDIMEAVQLVGRLKGKLEELSPPQGQPVPPLLAQLRKNYASQRKRWREVVEARFEKLLKALGRKTVPNDDVAWSCAELLDITPNIIDLFVKNLVPKFRSDGADGRGADTWWADLFDEGTTITSMAGLAQAVFAYIRTFIPESCYPPLAEKLWPAIVRLARQEDLTALLTWEKELLSEGSLSEPSADLSRRHADMVSKRDAAFQREVLQSVRKSLVADVTPLQDEIWVSRGVVEVVESIQYAKEKTTDGKLIQDIISLYAILRPGKGNIRRDAKAAMIFFNDCQYMIEKTAGIAAPKMPMLRRLGEKHARQFLNFCVNEYRKHLPHDMFFDMHRHYATCETQLGETLALLKSHTDDIRQWVNPAQAEILIQWLAKEVCDMIFAILDGLQTRQRPSYRDIPALQQVLTPVASQIKTLGGPSIMEALCSLLMVDWNTLARHTTWVYTMGNDEEDKIEWSDAQIRILLFINPNVSKLHQAMEDIQMSLGR